MSSPLNSIEAAASMQTSVHTGICDASAATLDARHFVVADDEENILWIYDRAVPAPVGSVELWNFLGIGKKDETDIEGAAAVGDRIYWISSHGRNKRAEAAPSRFQFFASDIDRSAGQIPTVRLVGTSYKNLLTDLIEQPIFAKYNFALASTLAPKAKDGFNIEGLAATPDGRLLIGFRNPVPKGKALVIPINNPDELIGGGANPAARASFGSAIELDLQGRGIRSIDLVGAEYFIVAGPIDDAGEFGIYRWSGKPNESPVPVPVPGLAGLHPESLVAMAKGKLQIFSDDGRRQVAGMACKDLPKRERSFRSITINR
ncbi:MAG: DUF3616 domain-containing protein [Pseudomonadota bacterium]|nr:DUF3616 domain-containing protein [Pseudomonadota bacterium]